MRKSKIGSSLQVMQDLFGDKKPLYVYKVDVHVHISKLCMHPKIPLVAALLTGLEHVAPFIKILLTGILNISLFCLATKLTIHEGFYE